MVGRMLLLGVAAMGAASCGAVDTPGLGGAPQATFTHRTANSDVVLLWHCRQSAAGQLRVEGVIHSPWQVQPIRYPEVHVVGVDAQGRQTAEAAWQAPELQLFTNQRSSFLLELRTTGSEVRVDLYYQYRFNEEYDVSMIAGLPMAGSPRYAQTTRSNVVRDACSPTRHQAR